RHRPGHHIGRRVQELSGPSDLVVSAERGGCRRDRLRGARGRRQSSRSDRRRHRGRLPHYLLNDHPVLSESLVVLMSALTVFVAYRFWRRPRMVTVIVLGAVLALGALTRAEMVLLVPVLLIPLTLVLRSVPLRRRLILLIAGGLSSVVVL